MHITRNDVVHVADLARLELNEAAVDRYVLQIAEILDYVALLNQVDTSGVAPTSHAIALNNAFREDRRQPQLLTDQALANAPRREDDCFVVPKIVG